MKKTLIVTALIGLIGTGAVFAADRENFSVTKLRIGNPSVALTATGTEINQVCDGATATAAEINAACDLSARVSASNVTNGQEITLSATVPNLVLNGTGGANDTTNTFTIATPYPLYGRWTITAASATTNLLKLADSTTVVAIGSDWVGDGTDTLEVWAPATNELVKVGGSNN